LKTFSKIFQEYSKNISPKAITKAVKKQMDVTRVIPFAPKHQNIHVSPKHNLKNLVDGCKKYYYIQKEILSILEF